MRYFCFYLSRFINSFGQISVVSNNKYAFKYLLFSIIDAISYASNNLSTSFGTSCANAGHVTIQSIAYNFNFLKIKVMRTTSINKRIGRLIPMMMFLYLVSSCTEMISFDFNEVESQIVIEAFVPESKYAEVIITKTLSFNTDNKNNQVTGAIVILEDGNGLMETLSEFEPGRYRSSKIKGVPGMSYKLTVETDDYYREIKSVDVMPTPVCMTRLRVRESNMPDVNGLPLPAWEVIVEYEDPANEKNYYRFVEYINGKPVACYVEDDKFNNGMKNKSFLTSVTRSLVPGDTLTVEMQVISKAVYDYFYGFSMLNTLPQGSNAVNPVTNISGVKLGYFSAHTVNRRSVVIK